MRAPRGRSSPGVPAAGRRQGGQSRGLPERLERREGGEGGGAFGEGAGLRPALAQHAAADGDLDDPGPRPQAEDGVPREVVPAGQLRRPARRVEQGDGRRALEPEGADERDGVERRRVGPGDERAGARHGRGGLGLIGDRSHAAQCTRGANAARESPTRRRRTRTPRSGAACGTACSRARTRGG